VNINQKDVRYKCSFCGRLFKTCSACAKHIESKSLTKSKRQPATIFPSDIILVDKSKEKEE